MYCQKNITHVAVQGYKVSRYIHVGRYIPVVHTSCIINKKKLAHVRYLPYLPVGDLASFEH